MSDPRASLLQAAVIPAKAGSQESKRAWERPHSWTLRGAPATRQSPDLIFAAYLLYASGHPPPRGHVSSALHLDLFDRPANHEFFKAYWGDSRTATRLSQGLSGHWVPSPVTDEICAGRQGEGETEPKQIETLQG